MPDDAREKKITETKESLERIQNFDVSTLSRENDLGIELNFKEAIPSAQKLVDFFKMMSTNVLPDLPDESIDLVKNMANSTYNIFNSILAFTTNQPNPHQMRDSIVNQTKNQYNTLFANLNALISFSTSKSADFQRLETDARAAMQSILDEGEALTNNLEQNIQEANQILDNIRKTAAEHGVSQQAIYFQEESEKHSKQSDKWLKYMIWIAAGLILYAISSIFIHKIDYLRPQTLYDSVQLAVSKFLIFAVISYLFYIAAKNFMAHKHNSIVNKHRQNALMTYKAIIDASKDVEKKEVILTHASACIFGPQNTGYSRDYGPSAPKATSVIELLGKPFSDGN